MNRNITLLVLCLVIAISAVSYSQVASLPKRWTEAEQVISKYVDANDVYLASQTARAAASMALRVDTANASVTSNLSVGNKINVFSAVENCFSILRNGWSGINIFMDGSGPYFDTLVSHSYRFYLNTVEAVRINASGALLVATTTGPIGVKSWVEGYWGASMPIVIAYNNLAVATDSAIVATYTNEVLDTHNCFDKTTGVFTAPVKGLYSANAYCLWAGEAAPAGYRQIYFVSPFAVNPATTVIASSTYFSANAIGEVVLNAGQTIVAYYAHTQGAVTTVAGNVVPSSIRIRCIQQLP
jgi:hypothetical protein